MQHHFFCVLIFFLIVQSGATIGNAGTLTEKDARTPSHNDWSFDFEATHRTRYEVLENQFRAGFGEQDELISLTTSLKLTASRGAVFFLGEIVDARGYLDGPGSSVGANQINTLELVQAHIGFASEDVETIAGRFTLDLGSRRLVGRNRFRTALNAFTGVKKSIDLNKDDKVILVYTLPQIRLPNTLEEAQSNTIAFDDQDFDLQFWGAHYSKSWSPRLLSEVFLFGLHERDDQNERETRNRQLFTIGSRVFQKPEARSLDFEIESGFQFGSARATPSPLDVTDLDVRSAYVHAELGFLFDISFNPRISLDFDYATGDRSPDDDRFNRFDALFGPIAGDLGPTNLNTLITRANLLSPALRLEAEPSNHFRLTMAWRPAWLASKTDAFGSSGVRDRDGTSGRFAGHQFDAKVRYQLFEVPWFIEAGGAFFLNGTFFNTAPNANTFGDPIYGFIETRVAF